MAIKHSEQNVRTLRDACVTYFSESKDSSQFLKGNDLLKNILLERYVEKKRLLSRFLFCFGGKRKFIRLLNPDALNEEFWICKLLY